MKNEDFYQVIDSQLMDVINSDLYSNYFSTFNQDNQKKSFAFLIWFLRTYADISNVEDYITDGCDDSSCDIILERVDSQGVITYYVVQSKWNKITNCESEFESKELKSFLSDVQSVLRGDKEKGGNEKFNRQYDKLRDHIRKNGRVKVIYLSLKNNCDSCQGNIDSFKKTMDGDIDIEGFDINRLKIDYISREFKKSYPPNPLENIYDPSLDKINIEICRDAGNSCVEINSPFDAYVFLIKPKLLFELVTKYGVSLFNKNVRNPLLTSAINSEIKNTIHKNPAYFWYYNNGITAITRKIPKLSNEAVEFEVTGLQIINGAQTAYSIYAAYKNCSPAERAILDEEARITFRLLKSGGDDFDLKVTKYTNSQNPVSDRDFWSNDALQKRIQNYFFNTNYWYERREGEFRELPEGIAVISNKYFANSHLGFNLGGAVDVVKSAMLDRADEMDLVFTSRLDNKDGLYEKIFNEGTRPEDVHASFIMLDQVTELPSFKRSFSQLMYTNCFHVLSISRIVMEKYLRMKYGTNSKVTPFILKLSKNVEVGGEIEILRKIIAFSVELLSENVNKRSDEEVNDYIFNLMSKSAYFEIILDEVRAADLTIDEIEGQGLDLYLEEDDEKKEDEAPEETNNDLESNNNTEKSFIH